MRSQFRLQTSRGPIHPYMAANQSPMLFQVDLHGVVDLLSNHLYSSQDVFVRELLQNSVDAVAARAALEPTYSGRILIELIGSGAGATLVVDDDGIGLTEAEVHEFLATIGRTSKRGTSLSELVDFIGQFGVGLLACFMVSDEIVVQTRSVRPGSSAFEWRGSAEGTYTLSEIRTERGPGMTLYLRSRPGTEGIFQPHHMKQLIRHYGGLLPVPISFKAGGPEELLTSPALPWETKGLSYQESREHVLRMGERLFGERFADYIPVEAPAGALSGIGFVLGHRAAPNSPRRHRAYLKRMLLTERADNLLPNWAYFVRCLVNAESLRPTASREAFYEDATLALVRDQLGEAIRDWIVRLAEEEPSRLDRFVSIHFEALKALATVDDDFFRIIIDVLPFETNEGVMSIGRLRRDEETIRYTPDRDTFRQIGPIARAQGLRLVDAGYSYDDDLLARLPLLAPPTKVDRVDGLWLANRFSEPTLEDRSEFATVLRQGDLALQEFHTDVVLRRFEPAHVAALHCLSSEGAFLRSVEQAREVSDQLFSSVLDGLADQGPASGRRAQLVLNLDNPITRTLSRVDEPEKLRNAIHLLYAQSLLSAHRALTEKEVDLLNQSTRRLLEWGLA